MLGYDLWRDDGKEGDYSQLYHIDSILSISYLDYAVEPGRLYRYKYRGRNVNGFGEFSEPGYLYAASVPGQPQAPTLVAVSSDAITLQFYAPIDTGGASILSYLLVMDEGEINTTFAEVTSYSDFGGINLLLSHELTAATDGLITNTKRVYSFKFRASNSVGDSEFS